MRGAGISAMSPAWQGPSHQEDPLLKDRLNQVTGKVTTPAFLSGQSLGNELGLWIFDKLIRWQA